jgi:hypothetical protein
MSRAPRIPSTTFEPYGSRQSQWRPSPCFDLAQPRADRVVKKRSRDITTVRIGSYMADPTNLSATTVGSNLILIRRSGTSEFC